MCVKLILYILSKNIDVLPTLSLRKNKNCDSCFVKSVSHTCSYKNLLCMPLTVDILIIAPNLERHVLFTDFTEY